MHTFAAVQNEVEIWARNRQIIQNSSGQAQAHKTLEEAAELLEAGTRVKVLRELIQAAPDLADHASVVKLQREAMAAYRDAVADVAITVLIGSACEDQDFVECLGEGYNVIKNRKGTLRSDGVFVKETESK